MEAFEPESTDKKSITDDELSAVLRKWEPVRAPSTLEARVFGRAGRAPRRWSWKIRHLGIPVPVVGISVVALIGLVMWGVRIERKRPELSGARTSPSAAYARADSSSGVELPPAVSASSAAAPATLKLETAGTPFLLEPNGAGYNPVEPEGRYSQVTSSDGAAAAQKLPSPSGPPSPGTNGVGYPSCAYCPSPQYTDAARKVNFRGTVVVRAIIQTDGQATSIEVVKNPGFGLGAKAIEAVKTWRFKPAAGPDSTPVSTITLIEVNFQPPEQSTPPSTRPNGSPRIKVSAEVQAKKIIDHAPPVYPPSARDANVQGTVILHAIIARDGKVSQLDVVSGDPLLVQAALDAVRQWTYKTTLLNGTPVEVDTTVVVPFVLTDNP